MLFFFQYYKSQAKLYCKCMCGFFVWLEGEGVRFRLSAVGKWCMVNVAETQPGHKADRNKGADDAVREDRRELLLDIS